jgi:hypothetical protein
MMYVYQEGFQAKEGNSMRLLKAGSIIVVLLASAFVVTDQVLLAKLDARRDAIVAAGGHVDLSDFVLKLADGENGATFYRQAGVLLDKLDPAELDLEDVAGRYGWNAKCDCGDALAEGVQPLTPEEEARLAESVERYAEVFTAIEEGAKRPACQFGDYQKNQLLDEKTFDQNLDDMALIRSIGRLIVFRSVWESRHGNLDGGYHWLAVGMHVVNGLENDPVVITGLVGPAVEGMLMAGLQVLLCENGLPAPFPTELLAELETAGNRLRLARFFEGENCYSQQMYSEYVHFWNRPLVTLNQISMLNDGMAFLSIMRESDEALYVQRLDEFAEKTQKPSWKAPYRALADLSRSSLPFSAKGVVSSAVQARAAQVVIALEQWKAQHGAYPASLDEVGPLPADPLTAKPFEYQREGDGFMLRAGSPFDRAVKWCVGS